SVIAWMLAPKTAWPILCIKRKRKRLQRHRCRCNRSRITRRLLFLELVVGAAAQLIVVAADNIAGCLRNPLRLDRLRHLLGSLTVLAGNLGGRLALHVLTGREAVEDLLALFDELGALLGVVAFIVVELAQLASALADTALVGTAVPLAIALAAL